MFCSSQARASGSPTGKQNAIIFAFRKNFSIFTGDARSHLSTWLGRSCYCCPGLPAAFCPTGSQNPLCWWAADCRLHRSHLQTTPERQKKTRLLNIWKHLRVEFDYLLSTVVILTLQNKLPTSQHTHMMMSRPGPLKIIWLSMIFVWVSEEWVLIDSPGCRGTAQYQSPHPPSDI